MSHLKFAFLAFYTNFCPVKSDRNVERDYFCDFQTP